MLFRYWVMSLSLLSGLTGCAVNRTLSFPPDSEQVAVTVKGRSDLAVQPIDIGYRSTKCTVTRRNSNFEPYEVAAYNGINQVLVRQEGTDLYRVNVPVDGGGRCQWRLSYIKLEVDYIDLARLGGDITPDGGGRAYVLFDEYGGPAGGASREVSGDLDMKEDYYIWVRENFIGRHSKFGGLFRNGSVYLTYKARRARKVYFEPIVHADYVVYSKGPVAKVKGARTSYLYPDGSSAENSRGKPDFQKLQCIRLPSQCKK